MTQDASTSCPHCGAPLRSQQIACAYCGTRAAKPGLAPAPEQEPNAPLDENSRSSTGYLAIAMAMGLVVLGVGAAAFLSAREPGPTPDLSGPPRSVTPLAPSSSVVAADPPPPLRARAGVLVLDVDNDGTDDIVARFDRAGRSWIGAVSGVSGREIWRALETTPHARSADIGEVRAVVAQTLVATTPTGDVRGFDAKTGRLLWTEPAVSGWDGGICVGADYVGFAAGRAITKLGLATGARATGATLASCTRGYTSNSAGPNFTVIDAPEVSSLPEAKVSGITVVRALVPDVGTVRVLLGHKNEGGALAVASKSKLLWSAPLSASSPDDGVLPGTPRASVRQNRVVVPYHSKAGASLRVAAFDLATGRRAWEVSFDEEDAEGAEPAISRDGHVILRTSSGKIRVLAMEDGALQSTIGEP